MTQTRAARPEVDSRWANIDADIHPTILGGFATVSEYLPRELRQRLDPASLPITTYDSVVGVVRADARGPNGEPPASSASLISADLLDQHDVLFATLVSLEQARAAYMPGNRDAALVIGAFNQHLADHWLSDTRLRLAVGVSPHDAQLAAGEIRRWAPDPRVCAVFLPLTGILMGGSHFDPVYSAAVEAGLPILLHPLTGEGQFQRGARYTGGLPANYPQRHTMVPQIAQSSVASLVFEGVFERFPTLKVIFTEFGFGWMAPLLWRMDRAWRDHGGSVPLVKRSPIDYAVEHIRVTSQPVEEPPDDAWFAQMLDMMFAERTLCFSSDYPHWDNDFPRRTFQGIDPHLRRRILVDNALETLRLS